MPAPNGRTLAFARVLGPYFFIIPATIAMRAGELGTMMQGFVREPLWAWVLGAMLLFSGLVIIAFHQYWRHPAAVAISLLGWFLGLRGLVLLVAPQAIIQGAGMALDMVPIVRMGFGALALVGVWLTYVGWASKAPAAA